jgi:hypothetical protein
LRLKEVGFQALREAELVEKQSRREDPWELLWYKKPLKVKVKAKSTIVRNWSKIGPFLKTLEIPKPTEASRKKV